MNGRLEYLRAELRAERLSYGEISELQDMADAGEIPDDDLEMLEAAGVPETTAEGREMTQKKRRWVVRMQEVRVLEKTYLAETEQEARRMADADDWRRARVVDCKDFGYDGPVVPYVKRAEK